MLRMSHLVVAVATLASGVIAAHAQAPADTLHYAVTYVSALPSGSAPMTAAFRQYRDASRKQDGFMRFELFEQVGRPGHFAVVETWRDAAAFDAHASAAHSKRFREALQPLRVSGYDERPYKSFSVAPAKSAAASGAIHVLSHVDTIGGVQGGGPEFVRKVAEASRQEPGCLRYDVLQSTMRANHFTVVETWASQAAFDAHATAAHTKQYRESVQPVTGSPLDERVYKAVD
jgi:quinol monooxygenase YgiN